MTWSVFFGNEFDEEFKALDTVVQDALLANAKLLGDYGPHLGCPHADTLEGSGHANLKELRFEAAGSVWRVAFAFDPRRQAILLVAGDKSGVGQKRFYKRLIARADKRYTAHLKRVAAVARKGK